MGDDERIAAPNDGMNVTLNDEESVKKALGITSFREMSKEKMLAFVASMPDMAKEVRLKLVEQIPAFREFALEAVNVVERTFTKTIDSNDEGRAQLHEAFADVRDAIKSQLAQDGLTEEHRRLLTEQLIKLTEQESAKDSENKQFSAQQADGTRKTVVVLAGIGVIAAVVLAGGKVGISHGEADS